MRSKPRGDQARPCDLSAFVQEAKRGQRPRSDVIGDGVGFASRLSSSSTMKGEWGCGRWGEEGGEDDGG